MLGGVDMGGRLESREFRRRGGKRLAAEAPVSNRSRSDAQDPEPARRPDRAVTVAMPYQARPPC